MSTADYKDFIDGLSKANSFAEIHGVCAQICKEYGFEQFLYGARLPTSLTKPYYVFISGYPTEWWERYKQNNYIRLDPLVHFCSENTVPINWETVHSLAGEDPTARQLMGEAGEFGLRQGISIPIHTRQGDSAMLNFSTGETGDKTIARINGVAPFLFLLTTYVHEAAKRVFDDRDIPVKQNGLTLRERECLLWAAEGKTAWEISQILNISERTANFHLQNVTEKLGVINRQHAVARAVSQGIISPQL